MAIRRNKIKRTSPADIVFFAILFILMAVFAAIFIYELLWMFTGSMRGLQEFNLSPFKMYDVSFEDIIKFHHDFEKIHPFQDGNGRVGRLIAFKEALRFDIVPFIIEDSKKMFYYRGLKEWNNEKGFLIETCLDGQDTYKALLRYFGIPFSE